MARRNPLLFKQDEYQFLHKVYLLTPKTTRMYKVIKEKKGIGLVEKEILFVKEKFEEWKAQHKNELLWMK